MLRRFSYLLSLLFLLSLFFFSCNQAQDDEDTNVQCGCGIVIQEGQSCADTLAASCPDPNQYFEDGLCDCICNDNLCGANCDVNPNIPCQNGWITLDCECTCASGFGGLACEYAINSGRQLFAKVVFAPGDTATYESAALDYTISSSSIVLDGFNDVNDTFVYIELTNLGTVATNIPYPIGPPFGFASVRITRFNGEVWTNIPGVDPGYFILESYNAGNQSFRAVFEFPISNGAQTAWVRGGFAYANN